MVYQQSGQVRWLYDPVPSTYDDDDGIVESFASRWQYCAELRSFTSRLYHIGDEKLVIREGSESTQRQTRQWSAMEVVSAIMTCGKGRGHRSSMR